MAACRAPLTEPADGGRTWTCPAGHAYDASAEGYVNLLITHQRRKHTPGDSAEMLRARRRVLDSGAYAHLASALRDAAGPATSAGDVLDAGCGEGYYTRSWDARVWGVDIAKAAVRMAAKRGDAHHHYAVASVYDLPLPDGSMDLAVNVFAPVHSPELARVLRPDGRLVTATPGPDHLASLKARLFAAPEQHDEAGPLDSAGDVSGFELVERTRAARTIGLRSPGDVADLLGMTPYAWYVDPATKAAVEAIPALDVETDFVVSVYRRTP